MVASPPQRLVTAPRGPGLPPARHPGKLKEGGAHRRQAMAGLPAEASAKAGSRVKTSATVGAPRGGRPWAQGSTGASQAPPMRRDTHGDLPRVRLLALHPPLEGAKKGKARAHRAARTNCAV